jgi:hypothetical protein
MLTRPDQTQCSKCGNAAEFGYITEGAMTWYCGEHRLARYWADARADDRIGNPSSLAWEGWNPRSATKTISLFPDEDVVR